MNGSGRWWQVRAVLWFALLTIRLQVGELYADEDLRASYSRRLDTLANLHAELTVEHRRVVRSEEEIEAIRARLPPRLAKMNPNPLPAEETFSYSYRRGGNSLFLDKVIISSSRGLQQLAVARTPYRSEQLQLNKRKNGAFGRITDPNNDVRPEIFLEYAIGVGAWKYPSVLDPEILQDFTFQKTEDGGILKFSPNVRRHEWRVDTEHRITEYSCTAGVTQVHIINSDFDDVGGYSLPRTISVTESDGSRQEIVVKSYSLEPPSDDLFMIKYPKGTRIEDQRTGYRFVKEGSSAVTESFLRDAAVSDVKTGESNGGNEGNANLVVVLVVSAGCIFLLFAIVAFRRKGWR